MARALCYEWDGTSVARIKSVRACACTAGYFCSHQLIDRGDLSIAAPLLKEELRISASELGILLSAFFWTYTAMQFVSGWIVDRFDVNRVIAAGFLLWSLATAATGLVRGFTMLLAMRLMLGIGESVSFLVTDWRELFACPGTRSAS